MKQGKPEPLEYTKRHGYFAAQSSIRDPYDALVELITNADDSYSKLERYEGSVLIEFERRHKGGRLIIRDRAQGMTLEEMKKKIKKVGDRTSNDGDRGIMGRGAKDCAILGDLEFESIKDDYYHKCAVTHNLDFVPYEPSSKATKKDRDRLGVSRGSGTIVVLNLLQGIRTPQYERLKELLPRHYALRDIFSADSPIKILLRDLNDRSSRPESVIYHAPEGALVKDIEFEVAGYAGAKAKFILFKAPEALTEAIDRRFQRAGVLVKGRRAIHESTFFTRDLEQDIFAAKYFGKLVCPFIDDLCKEFDENRKRGVAHPSSNPVFLIDQHRQAGLNRDHPFTKALFETPLTILQKLVESDKEEDRKAHAKVANEETEKQLKLLADAASRFLRDQLEEFEETSDTDDIDPEEFRKKGLLIIPTTCTLPVGEEKTFTLRVRRREGVPVDDVARVLVDKSGVEVLVQEFRLSPSRTDENVLTGNFRVRATSAGSLVTLTVKYDGLPAVDAVVDVIEKRIEDNEIPSDLVFDKELYLVQEGKRRHLILKARVPEVIQGELEPIIESSNEFIPIVGQRCLLKPVPGTKYAEGEIIVEGRKLYSNGKIVAKIGRYKAETDVKVIQKRRELGPPLKIDIRPEHYGNFRARWDRPNNPNLLLIAARHESVARYLGRSEEKFPGQKLPLFKILLAEIVAEYLCRKILEEQAKQVPWEFENLGVDEFYARHNRLHRECIATFHKIQLSDGDVKQIEKLWWPQSTAFSMREDIDHDISAESLLGPGEAPHES